MPGKTKRRSFLKTIALGGIGATLPMSEIKAGNFDEKAQDASLASNDSTGKRKYNAPYIAENLSRVAFPIGGIGAGMFCLEGSGAISHMSVRNKPDIFNEPAMFAAIHIKRINNGVKIIEGQVPQWKFFGQRGTGNGASGTTF